MELHPITTKQEYGAALRAIEALWTAPAGSPEAEQLESLVTLVEAYEATHHPIDPPDPIDVIKFRMEQAALSLQDLEADLGRHAADVLARAPPGRGPPPRCGRRRGRVPPMTYHTVWHQKS